MTKDKKVKPDKTKKKQYSDALNEILKVDIVWDKLSYEDLIQWATLVNNPEILIKRLSEYLPEGSKEKEVHAMAEVMDAGLTGITAAKGMLDKLDGPIISRIRKFRGGP